MNAHASTDLGSDGERAAQQRLLLLLGGCGVQQQPRQQLPQLLLGAPAAAGSSSPLLPLFCLRQQLLLHLQLKAGQLLVGCGKA